MSSQTPSRSASEADRVLRERRRSRNKVACYPCKKRKVKCDAGQPCAMCVRRGHPAICMYLENHTGRSTPGDVIAPIEQPRPKTRREPITDTQFLGSESTTAYMQRLATERGDEVARDVSPALALGNVVSWNPFQCYNERNNGFSELETILPEREDIQKYYQSYRSFVHPLSPLMDIEPLELKIADHLEGRVSFVNDVISAATIALVLAVLACGAQYSDLNSSERRSNSRNLASKSFRALQLANYLVRPTASCLQTLILLGLFIRNDGDADASWALLGTTMRLAQSVGLHDVKTMRNLSTRDKEMRSQLWKTILQHDSILSLCFDRPMFTPTLPLSSFPSSTPAESLDYSQMMWEITRLCADNLTHRNREVDYNRSQQCLIHVDSIFSQSSPHLQERSACLRMHDRLEHHTINIHINFMISVICRPAFLGSDLDDCDDKTALAERGKAALTSTVSHFLCLHRLTTYAVRTWTTLHEALSSALLLELLREPDKSAELTGLQNEFLEVVISSLDSGSTVQTGLSKPHARAIAALRKIAQKRASPSLATPIAINSATQPVSGSSNVTNLPDFDSFTFDESTLSTFDTILWDTEPDLDSQFWLGLNSDFTGT
ncbi:fungal-specific transcription factor domain-containing protein [Boeremia exigua]|uniref:fungal-specific transcription factor domain-containing protein n=1 Tax=Boeremia exigua TaxID=749465 RepID=UPI001E8E0731|nr:fungal-specific transcription factor domain-containing protein [Boeremia exigua]KAH6638479.1 fungal-specific transcription factor domain-containing protein [Boeremia exigua]